MMLVDDIGGQWPLLGPTVGASLSLALDTF
jgi:hypothetical protein